MEVKNPVTISVRSTIRTIFELFTIAFVILLPLAITAFAVIDTGLPMWAISTFGVMGTLIWWRLCWFAFWYII